MSDKLKRLRALADELTSYEVERKKNTRRLKELFDLLQLGQKCGEFNAIFDFKAINLSGITLTKEKLGSVTEGKYAQIIGIKYVSDDGKRRAKNINLRYFGRVEQLESGLKELIVEFVLRWRLEKSYRGVDHYRELVERCDNLQE
ncbi:hypothetical protein NNO_1058 [Hydrogenimonas sp.]|nr:hypothetical protein NNO_1058 [Hydrogenimonas sp.]